MNRIKPFQISRTDESSPKETLDPASSEIPKETEDSVSHYLQTSMALQENELINSLLCNHELSNKAKAIITKEIKKYV